jgi:Family of unknown function (DUF6062)
MAPRLTLEENSVYVAVLDALVKPGCAVCRIMEEASASYLDTLFYEQVTDVEVRRKLRRARGLCNWHSCWASKMTSAALGISIIARDLIEEECTRLAALEPQSFWRRLAELIQARLPCRAPPAYLRAWRARAICPACHVAVEHERHALETVLNFIDEAQFARHYEGSTGLCLPHTARAAELAPSHPKLGYFSAIQRGKYTRLTAELEEFCRKHDYRFTHEAWGAEADAWQRALEILSGKLGVFGSAIDRQHSARRPRFLRNLFEWWK